MRTRRVPSYGRMGLACAVAIGRAPPALVARRSTSAAQGQDVTAGRRRERCDGEDERGEAGGDEDPLDRHAVGERAEHRHSGGHGEHGDDAHQRGHAAHELRFDGGRHERHDRRGEERDGDGDDDHDGEHRVQTDRPAEQWGKAERCAEEPETQTRDHEHPPLMPLRREDRHEDAADPHACGEGDFDSRQRPDFGGEGAGDE